MQLFGSFPYINFHILECRFLFHTVFSKDVLEKRRTANSQGRKIVQDHQSVLFSSQVRAVVTPTVTVTFGMTIPTLTCSLTCSCHQPDNKNPTCKHLLFTVPGFACVTSHLFPGTNLGNIFKAIIKVMLHFSYWMFPQPRPDYAKGCEDRKELVLFACTLPSEELCIVLNVVLNVCRFPLAKQEKHKPL